MKDVIVYTVVPKLPDRLKPLEEMARNVWFAWNLEVLDLYRSIDPNLWEETGHNPLAMVSSLGNERIQELLEDDGFLLRRTGTQETNRSLPLIQLPAQAQDCGRCR